MANEKRLIDANALSEKIGNMKNEITHNRGGYRYCSEDEKNEWDKLDFFDNLVCEAPTVDAVEVVRCVECKDFVRNSRVNTDRGDCYRYGIGCIRVKKIDDFCSYGERRTDEA